MPEVIVAGHICLDIIPEFRTTTAQIAEIMSPGKLVNVGAAALSTGGAVANTGGALHRLGFDVGLLGKVGRDVFGDGILSVLRAEGRGLDSGMIVCDGESTSYTVVISPPGIDRIFLHCPGANDTFAAADIPQEKLAGARLFHFGYPPLMKRMYADNGAELKKMLAAVKGRGVCTSLDMTRPDPDSASGKLDWKILLANCLPEVDIFLPSLEELLFMLDRKRYDAIAGEVGHDNVLNRVDGELLGSLSARILELGAKIAVIKVGSFGLYLRTSAQAGGLALFKTLLAGEREAWNGRELYSPCYAANLVGTTGSGDCTIAGALGGMLKGMSPAEALNAGVAVGACSVEAVSATGGVPAWEKVVARQKQGWKKQDKVLPLVGWTRDATPGVWRNA